MQIVYKTLDEIYLNPNNPRLNDKAVDSVANSIKDFGFKNCIVINTDGMILAGNTRYKASKKLNLEKVPCIVADDLTEAQQRAFVLADNKTAELAEWDMEALEKELAELTAFDVDMTAFGFDESIFADIELTSDDGFAEDMENEVNEYITTLGDIWQLGEHRLICGDSTDKATIERLMSGTAADLLLTDPPYNVAVENSDGLTIENDNMEKGQFYEFLQAAFYAADTAMKAGAGFYIWHGESEGLNFRRACEDTGWNIKQCLIWVKNHATIGRQDYQWKHEPCLYGWKDGAAHYFINQRKQKTVIDNEIDFDLMTSDELRNFIKELLEPSTIIRADKPQKNGEHPTMKPIPLIEKQIKNSTKTGEIVLDIFGGSGSTLIACEQLKRKCYTCELDPKYCDVIIKRWENLTGQKAERIESA